MGGNVLSPGWHENPKGADATGGPFGGNIQDQQKVVVSPTINLKASGAGVYNGMGLDTEIAGRRACSCKRPVVNVYDYDVSAGNGWRIGWQSYPATQANGVKTWGEMRKDITFNATGGILGASTPSRAARTRGSDLDHQLVASRNSVRVYIESMARCYTLPLTSTNCSPAGGVKRVAISTTCRLASTRRARCVGDELRHQLTTASRTTRGTSR